MNTEFRRAIVLGAGASCAYGASPTGLRPPLAKELIPTYSRLPMADDRRVLVGHLVNYVRNTRGVDPADFPLWQEDLEAFFTEIDETISVTSGKIANNEKLSQDEFYWHHLSIGAYNQLVFLFASIFNEIQNGPLSATHLHLACELESTDAVITFNWDTLLDRALWASGKWAPHNGYLLRPEAIYDDGWKAPDTFAPIRSCPLYIKMHGSTNWLAPYHHAAAINSRGERFTLSHYAIDKLYVYLQATIPYPTYEKRYWGPYQPFSYCYYPPNLPVSRDNITPGNAPFRMVVAPDLPEHGKFVVGEQDVFSMPLIVPPVRNKQYQRYGSVFTTLWSVAQEILSGCIHLYIIGYSFPPTDIATRTAFARALQSNQRLERLTIINPSPEPIYELVTRDFGVSPEKVEIRARRFELPRDSSEHLL